MPTTWTSERKAAFHRVNEHGFSEIEPGLRANRPVVRVTPADKRCVHGYYTMSPLSADGSLLTYFEFDETRVDRTSGRPISGRVVVAEADGSEARPIVEMGHGSACQGVMQQWVGPGHRLGWVDYTARAWTVTDLDSGESWNGEGQAREFAPEGEDLFLQTPEQIHLLAEEKGQTLSAEEVAARIIDYRTGEEKVRVSVADVLEIHPEADEARSQHMCFKQTLFSADGERIALNFSNAWYSRNKGTEPFRHEKLIARRDGSGLRCLGTGASHPSWHPSGDYYTAVAPDSEGVKRFMMYPVDGSPPFALGPDWLGTGHPSFQPGEARYLAVDVYVPSRGHAFLRLYDLVELTYEDLLVAEYDDYTNNSGTHLHPAWSPDGNSLFIASAHAGYAQVFRVEV